MRHVFLLLLITVATAHECVDNKCKLPCPKGQAGRCVNKKCECVKAIPPHDTKRLKIIQFTMAKCPMTTSWFADFAKIVMSEPSLRSRIDFEQSFVGGDIGEGPVNATNWMRCFHGPSECEGHTIMLCARNISRRSDPYDYRWFDMVTCMDGPLGIPGCTYNRSDSIPNDAERCADKARLDWVAISQCASGSMGADLLRASHYQTMRLFAQHGGYTPPGHGYRPPKIPNIWIAGKEYNDPLVQALDPYYDLKQRVCDAMPSPPVAACQ